MKRKIFCGFLAAMYVSTSALSIPIYAADEEISPVIVEENPSQETTETVE